jgi:hypothetical protein
MHDHKNMDLTPYQDILHPAYAELIKARQTAEELHYFNILGIPGLLHTEDYSRAVTQPTQFVPMTATELQLFVELRLKQQWHILGRPKPPRLDVLLDESLLHRHVGGIEVMREQLLHLIKLAQLPHITVRVLPLSRPIDYYGEFGLTSFTLLKFRDGNETQQALYREPSAYRQSFSLDPFHVRAYGSLFRYLWEDALSAEKSQTLIERIIEQLAALKS